MEDPGHILAKEARHKELLKIEGYLQVFRDYNWCVPPPLLAYLLGWYLHKAFE